MSDIESGPSLFDDIQAIETFGDYGSKVQTLVRHLCYLKHADPGAKSIIFSAWADSLHSTREHPI
jgi:E3 ubiquitin-protein ligase SHPRH